MKKLPLLIFSLSLFLTSCDFKKELIGIKLKTDSFGITINETGQVTRFEALSTGTNYLSVDTLSYLISINIGENILTPLNVIEGKGKLILNFPGDITAEIQYEEKPSHLNFELISLKSSQQVDLIIWGPYSTNINKVIGETVGVVQGEDFAIGIQSLNPKTLGGYPWNANDCMPQIDIFEQADLSDLSEKGKRGVLYRVEAAKPADSGSTLQAYSRNREKERVIENWGHKNFEAPAFNDGGVIGSKIALFGCPVANALEKIGRIEIDENLPHPLINGEWGKTAPEASSAYIILSFGEDDIEEAIAVTKKAGLKYLYHPDPFVTWGHFRLNEKHFPDGINGLKRCVDIAREHGITVGLHTLSNFISTNDPYVTPVPDNRLAKIGSSIIIEAIDESQTEISIASPVFFNQYGNNHLKTVKIENELIRYGTVSENEPWKLLNCERGAFNTNASSHSSQIEISKLADHGYKVFLTNSALSIEVAETIAELFNKTGVRQISFDGLEGNRSTGMGNYGEVLFTNSWYDKLNDDIRSNYIADASRTSHYFWHIYTRMNWGEPWYGGFRESQTDYRLKNQKYFKRNLMPGMLGWFKMTPETSIEDAEWLLARSAAFNAGFAFVTYYETIEKNGNANEIMALIGEWEKVRMAGLFTDEQKQYMEDVNNEFTLHKEEDYWLWTLVYSNKFRHEYKVRQPGEPLYSNFEFENPSKEQAINFILTAVDSDIKGISFEIDNYKKISLPVSLNSGESIKYAGDEKAYVFDKNWQLISSFEIDPAAFKIASGNHAISFDCQFDNSGDNPVAKLEVRLFGEPEAIRPNRK